MEGRTQAFVAHQPTNDDDTYLFYSIGCFANGDVLHYQRQPTGNHGTGQEAFIRISHFLGVPGGVSVFWIFTCTLEGKKIRDYYSHYIFIALAVYLLGIFHYLPAVVRAFIHQTG